MLYNRYRKLKGEHFMIKREEYLKKIRGFYDQDLIKVITGIRRSGKSTLLKQIIDELFTNLSNNVYLIPYSVKCICKMIILLIRQRFPDITTLKQNVLLANFFFGKLLLQILIKLIVQILILLLRILMIIQTYVQLLILIHF